MMARHSQIHYLWPTVENLLAQRGRRQPMWLLDATLFLGHGAAYRLPLQFQDQVDQAMLALLRARTANSRDSERGMRLLIVDDAMVRARTAETILAEFDRAVRKAREKARKEFGDKVEEVDPIEWIRYFFRRGMFPTDRTRTGDRMQRSPAHDAPVAQLDRATDF